MQYNIYNTYFISSQYYFQTYYFYWLLICNTVSTVTFFHPNASLNITTVLTFHQQYTLYNKLFFNRKTSFSITTYTDSTCNTISTVTLLFLPIFRSISPYWLFTCNTLFQQHLFYFPIRFVHSSQSLKARCPGGENVT